MIIHGMSLSQSILWEANETSRFWYWFGASGRRYIHSVYPADACPPLPGAVFLAVRRIGNLRTVLKVGRFPVTWDVKPGKSCAIDMANPAVNEIHVHLLAKCEADAEAIVNDLRTALEQEEEDDSGARSLGLAA
jgi:hypothetical protein